MCPSIFKNALTGKNEYPMITSKFIYYEMGREEEEEEGIEKRCDMTKRKLVLTLILI